MGTKSEFWIVGLTGKNASGKGEAACVLKRRGFQYCSLSDILRQEAKTRGIEPSRQHLIELGQKLRIQEGPGVLASRTLNQLKEGRHVVDSIRHPLEVEVLRKAGHFFLIGIDAPIKTRFERARKRGRNENALTLKEFQSMENQERSERFHAQQLDRCLDMSDIVIQNSGTLQDLEKKILNALKESSFNFKN